jgi:hypothetical protein
VRKIAVFFVFVSLGAGILPIPLSADSDSAGAAETPEAGRSAGGRLKETLRSYTLSLESQFGALWGRGEEQVYEDDLSDRFLSRLFWDVKPLWYTGMVLEFSQRDPREGPGFFSALSVKFGLPALSGVMEDRDWVAPGGELSHYSRHDNLTNGALLLDGALGLSVPAWPFLVFRFSFGLSYSRFSWAAVGGYYRYGQTRPGPSGPIYAPLADSDPAYPLSGTVIAYSQDWLFLPFTLGLTIFPGRLFSGALYYGAGPLIKFFGRDDHYLRIGTADYSQFIDESSEGYVLEPGGEFRFSPGERIGLLIGLSWRAITTGPHGKSFGRYTGQGTWGWNFLGNVSGGAFRALDLRIGLEVRL